MRSPRLRVLGVLSVIAGATVACGRASPPPTPPAAPRTPCFTIHGDPELRAKDAKKMLEELVRNIRLSPEDEALRNPKSMTEVKAIMRRDAVYFFPAAAAYARSLNTVEGRFSEAHLELLLGESQLVASQILSTQEAWVGGDLRVARANLAGEGNEPNTDRGRMLAQLIRVVEEGNKMADALGVVAPSHLSRGAEVIRQLRSEAPNDARTSKLAAEYHRLRGEWTEFDAAMKVAESSDEASPTIPYLRGMEQLERFHRPDLGVSLIRECLRRFPKFLRGEAALVLMATTPAEAYRELERLKQMNQDHYLVLLLEPMLAADRELSRMQNMQSAQGAQSAPAASGMQGGNGAR